MIVVKGIPRKITIRKLSALQMKRSVHKGCKVFVVHIINERDKNSQIKVDDPCIYMFHNGITNIIIGIKYH